MQSLGWIEFTLGEDRPAGAVAVRLRRAGERWVAQLDGAGAAVGMGGSARSALRAALEPLGQGAVTGLLADVALLEPSRLVMDVERGA